MSLRFLLTRKSALTVAALTLALVAVLLVPAAGVSAQDDGAGIVVGTYQAQQVAQAVGFQQQVMQQMQGLQQRAQEAQQSGDQQAMQQIQMEAQQIQQDAAAKLLAEIESVMPQVAEQTGASIIATDVTWSAEDVTTEDVTQAIIDAMDVGGDDAAAETGDTGAGAETSEDSGE